MQLQVFTYEDESPFEFTTVDMDGEAWFVANDVMALLGLTNITETLRALDDDEKQTSVILKSGQNRKVWLVNESGLYNLIFKSKKPSAIRFRKWVTKVVLPAIRKTGSFDGIDRTATPNFVKRFNDNYMRIDGGYFSVISELFIILQGRFERLGYQIPDKAYSGKEIRPDVSVGSHFSKYLQKKHPLDCGKHKMYMHLFPNGLEIECRQYPDALLSLFRKFVLTEWIPNHASGYFQERDRKALDYIPKLISNSAA